MNLDMPCQNGSFQKSGALIWYIVYDVCIYIYIYRVYGIWYIVHGMWEFPKVRGPNIDPKCQGSYYKDTHNKDTQFNGNSRAVPMIKSTLEPAFSQPQTPVKKPYNPICHVLFTIYHILYIYISHTIYHIRAPDFWKQPSEMEVSLSANQRDPRRTVGWEPIDSTETSGS